MAEGFHPAELAAMHAAAVLYGWRHAAVAMGRAWPALRFERRRMVARFLEYGVARVRGPDSGTRYL